MDNITEKVIEIIVENGRDLKPEDVTMESRFVEDLGMDSLDVVELNMKLEEEFGMRMPDEVQENMHTVQHVVDFIRENPDN